jgi:hypothetical protein
VTTIAQVTDVMDRAAFDPAFRAQLVSAPAQTLQQAGIMVPEGLEVRVVENTADVKHLVVPRKPDDFSTDGSAQDASTSTAGGSVAEHVLAHARLVVDTWSDAGLRARFLANPAAVLAERGVTVPGSAQLRVLEVDDRVVYLTLPPLAGR